MNVQQLIRELKEKLAEFEDSWEPQGGKWLIKLSGTISTKPFVNSFRQFGSEFKTIEAAEKAAKAYRKYHRLYKLAEELNEGWEPDWSTREEKWEVFEITRQEIVCIPQIETRSLCGIYFKDRATAKKAIKIIEQGGLD